ncbi:gliding motility protein [Streptomyces rugosispiralis]|uniref:Gliding motility protein n=1 Tax=Streptomyces rugosispiralis TaxID=2967341 RepID=A0ABT1VCK4_9ACTN|nr:gliding motility protein [Streptomyces rugosispiralis]MCQ8194698.1 gliding motility protein [Streptomyces rugosispiralis]
MRDAEATADALASETESGTADGAEAARSGKENPTGEGAGIPKQQSAAEAADSETGESARA